MSNSFQYQVKLRKKRLEGGTLTSAMADPEQLSPRMLESLLGEMEGPGGSCSAF